MKNNLIIYKMIIIFSLVVFIIYNNFIYTLLGLEFEFNLNLTRALALNQYTKHLMHFILEIIFILYLIYLVMYYNTFSLLTMSVYTAYTILVFSLNSYFLFDLNSIDLELIVYSQYIIIYIIYLYYYKRNNKIIKN